MGTPLAGYALEHTKSRIEDILSNES